MESDRKNSGVKEEEEEEGSSSISVGELEGESENKEEKTEGNKKNGGTQAMKREKKQTEKKHSIDRLEEADKIKSKESSDEEPLEEEEKEKGIRKVGKVEIKVFAGQLPKTWEKEDVFAFFGEKAEIVDVKILRDKTNGQHKGCAFIRFASMTEAEEVLKKFNKYEVLDGASSALQLKFADGELERLGLISPEGVLYSKLFVGCIPKTSNEDDLRNVFSSYGKIEELHFIKEPDGTLKGCAFVKFASKEASLLAIQNLNGLHFMQNGDKPLEVRFADNKVRKAGPQSLFKPGPFFPPEHDSSHYLQGSGFYRQQQQHHYPYPPPSFAPPSTPASFIEYLTPDGRHYYYNVTTTMTQWEKPPPQCSVIPATQHQHMYLHQTGYLQNSGTSSNTSSTAGASSTSQTDKVSQIYKQGPLGANLFIFHLPNEWTEQDLLHSFAPHGNIISARIMTDKQTGRSRGFGFVSYDNSQAAQNAVAVMNGFAVLGKRLKVQLKKGDGGPPHLATPMQHRFNPY